MLNAVAVHHKQHERNKWAVLHYNPCHDPFIQKCLNPVFRKPAIIYLITLILVSANAFAETLTRENFRTSVCNVKSMSVDFTIDQAFGEPLIRSKMRWEAGPNTADRCLDELSSFYVTIEMQDGDLGYVAINPRVGRAGTGFGQALPSSPSWHQLICSSSRENASCLAPEQARIALEAGLNYASFEVVTDASVVQPEKTLNSPVPEANSDDALMAFDRLLDEIAESPVRDEFGDDPVPVDDVARSVSAETISQKILSLVSSPLASYSTPARHCESERLVSNWVNLKSVCRISFRREIEHEFLCAERSEKREVKYASSVDLDFSTHIKSIDPLKTSDDGWTAVVIRLNEAIVSNTSDVKADRWQFAAPTGSENYLSLLADNFKQLKSHCEGDLFTNTDH